MDEKTYKRKGDRDMNIQNPTNTMNICPVRLTGRKRLPVPPRRVSQKQHPLPREKKYYKTKPLQDRH
jgi:hypothetical protein